MSDPSQKLEQHMEQLRKQKPEVWQFAKLQEVKGYVGAIMDIVTLTNSLFENDIPKDKFMEVIKVMSETKQKEAELIAKEV